MTSINIESKETLTREEQINLAGLETEAEQPLEIDRQYLIKEDAPKQTPVEEKPFVRSFFIYGMTGLGLVFLFGIWQLMTPKEASVKIVESTPKKQQPVEEVPQVDYRGKLALRDQKIQLAQKQQQSTPAEVVTSSRSVPTQKLTILGKQQQPLIAKGHFARSSNHVKTDLLVSSLSGLGKVGKVFTQPNTTSSVVSGSFGSSVTTTVDNRNREVWSAVLDGFFNPLADRISEREFRQEAELEKLPDIAVLEVGTEVSIIANDTFALD